MSWFPVDDAAHSHPKMRRAGLESLGLWTVSGSFCMAYLTDGFVPEWFVKQWPRGVAMAKRLVEAGLWKPGKKSGETGWFFHDWKAECTKEKVEEARAKARDRKRKSREQHRDEQQSSRVTETVTGRVTDASRHAVVWDQPNPTQPNPLTTVVDSGGDLTLSNARETNPPPRTCPQHPDGTEQPCTACADARRTHDAHRLAQRKAAQERARADAAQRVHATTAAAQEITRCDLCDDDGYRGSTVCDHQDHTETNTRGLELVRATLAATKAAQ